MDKKLWVLFILALLVSGCEGWLYETLQERDKVYGPAPPAINEAFASEIASPGDIWKVYLKANDMDGDMKAIFSTIEQPGVGVYPLSITPIRAENRKGLNGYIYLNTDIGAGANRMNFKNLTLRVRIQDMAGHFSNEASFPLSLQLRYKPFPPPLNIFNEKDLGPITIRLQPGPGV